MILSAISGSEAFALGSSKFHVFSVPTLDYPGKELHIGIAARSNDVPHITQSSYPEVLPAAPGYRDELGKWTRCNYHVPEGAVLKVFGYKKMSSTSRPSSGSQLIRMRENAAYRRIQFATVGWTKAQFQRVEVTGRFDLLDMDDARQLGIRIPPRYVPGFSAEQCGRVFTYQVIEPEIVPRVEVERRVVQDANGKAVEVATSRRKRMIDL